MLILQRLHPRGTASTTFDHELNICLGGKLKTDNYKCHFLYFHTIVILFEHFDIYMLVIKTVWFGERLKR